MKHALCTAASPRLALLAGLAGAACAAVAQAPAGTYANPTAALACWALVPCPPGLICGPGGGVGMNQKMGLRLPDGLVSGGAYSPLSIDIPRTPQQINNNLQVVDLRMLAPSELSAIRVSSMSSTIYRGARLTDPVAQQLRVDFTAGSLPAVSQTARFPLSPSVQGGAWLLTMNVQGSVPSPKIKTPGGTPASFNVACTLPVTVEQWSTQSR